MFAIEHGASSSGIGDILLSDFAASGASEDKRRRMSPIPDEDVIVYRIPL